MKRIAHIKWLLFANQTPPPWATAQKLQELDFLKSSIKQRKPITPAHSEIKKIKYDFNITTPPPPKELLKSRKSAREIAQGHWKANFVKLHARGKPARGPEPVPPELIGPGQHQLSQQA